MCWYDFYCYLRSFLCFSVPTLMYYLHKSTQVAPAVCGIKSHSRGWPTLTQMLSLCPEQAWVCLHPQPTTSYAALFSPSSFLRWRASPSSQQAAIGSRSSCIHSNSIRFHGNIWQLAKYSSSSLSTTVSFVWCLNLLFKLVVCYSFLQLASRLLRVLHKAGQPWAPKSSFCCVFQHLSMW